jgi:hypothetical protein
MYEKQEENRDITFEGLDSSLAQSREESENKTMHEADNSAETFEGPVEFSRVTEQTQEEILQDELSQPEHVISETELLPTTTQDELDPGDLSRDAHARNQAPLNAWSIDWGEVQDVADSKDGLGGGLQRTPFEVQVSQEDVDVTKIEDDKKDVVVPTENIVRCSDLEDEAAPRKHCGSVPSAQPGPHQQPSLVSSKQLLDGLKPSTKYQSSKLQASTKLPAQEPNLYDRAAPSLQGILEQPTTTRPAPTDSQLPSKPRATTRNYSTEILKPLTRNQSTQTPNIITRDRGTQTEVSIYLPSQEPKLQGSLPSPLHEILEKPSNTPPSSTGPQSQEKRSSDGRPEPPLRGILKCLTKDRSENLVQPTQERMEPGQERIIRGLARKIPVKTPEHATRLAKPDILAPRQVQPNTMPPPTLRPNGQALLT